LFRQGKKAPAADRPMMGLRRTLALTLLRVSLGLNGCGYHGASIPTGVAAPGHNWLEGGD